MKTKLMMLTLTITLLIIAISNSLNAASLEVTETQVTLVGTDGIKKADGSYVTIPPGAIIMWSGSVSAIPQGWILCNGMNGTPNLIDRFVIHADADSGGINNVGSTGGSKTITVDNIPAHWHTKGTLKTDSAGNHSHKMATGYTGGGSRRVSAENDAFDMNVNTDSAGAHTHAISGQTGTSGAGTDYMPKYYALAYIMKL